MQKASTRRRKAYGVFLRIAISYLWLYLVSKFKGSTYWSVQIKELNRKNAERVRAVMLELQGLFIKFGQLISTLSNILPEEFRTPLEDLQDKVPTNQYELMALAIQKELGKRPEELFTSFDTQPIAAASIGQVHRAKLGDKEVVVKIQHPKIDELVTVDLAIIKKIINLVARFMKIKGIEHLYQQIEQMILEELDYEQEAKSMIEIKQNLGQESKIYIPSVYQEFSSKKVLTIEYCAGVKISNIQQLKTWGLDLKSLTELLIEVYCKMILEDGFYHADPHPGNLLVNEQGQLILLDFGAVARLSKDMKEGIPKLIECIIKQDTEEMVKILRKLGFIAHGDDTTKIAETLIDSVQNFVRNELQLENLNIQNITPEQFQKAFQLINIKEMTKIMQIPKDWVLLNRAVVLVSGVAFLLTPDWNPLESLQPHLNKQLAGKNGVAQIFINSVKTQLNTLIAIPLELQKALQKINKGKVEIEIKDLQKGIKKLGLIGQQVVWLLCFMMAMCFYLYLDEGQKYPNLIWMFQGLAGWSLVAFLFKMVQR